MAEALLVGLPLLPLRRGRASPVSLQRRAGGRAGGRARAGGHLGRGAKTCTMFSRICRVSFSISLSCVPRPIAKRADLAAVASSSSTLRASTSCRFFSSSFSLKLRVTWSGRLSTSFFCSSW